LEEQTTLLKKNKTVLWNPIEYGGLNVLDFNTANCVFKNKWIKNYTKEL